MQQQQQQTEQSPIWAIDLFERRQFRNGNSEAQCIECGQRYDTTNLSAMTGHIVQEHAQYAAKLLAKQLEFAGHSHHQQQQHQTIKPEAEAAALCSSTNPTTTPMLNNNMFENSQAPTSSSSNAALGCSMCNAVDVVSAPSRPNSNTTWNTLTSDTFENSDVNMAFSPSASVLSTAEESISSTTTNTMALNNNDNNGTSYVDRFGKEWLLLVSAVGTQQHLDQVARQHLLCPKGPAKHDGRIYFSCCWTGLLSSVQQCPHRALYLPERKALFFRQTHNHPTPTGANDAVTPAQNNGNINSNNNAKNNGTAAPQKQRPQKQKKLQQANGCCNSNNEDIVSAFSAALPDIDNETTAGDRKDHLTQAAVISNTSNNNNSSGTAATIDRSFHLDRLGKRWHWLFDLDHIWENNGETMRQFCRTHFLVHSYITPRRVCFICKNNKPKSRAAFGNSWCPYRVKFVQERGAVFAYQSHNHPLVEKQGDDVVGANKESGSFSIGQQNVATPSADSAIITATLGTEDKENAQTFDVASNEPYVAGNGNVWKWFANIDVGECERYAERQQLTTFCVEHGLYRGSMNRKDDGTLCTYYLVCKEFRQKKCLYRAIYVVERRAIFDRHSHDHSTSTGSGMKLRKKKVNSKKGGARKRQQKGISSAENTLATATKNAYPRVDKLSAYDNEKLPPVIADCIDNVWHWLTKLADASNNTVLHFCSQFYVGRVRTAKDGTRATYGCRYRFSPINCPYKLLHLIDNNALYHRMAHNHPLPLGTELMQRFRSQRRANKFRSLNNKKRAINATMKSKKVPTKQQKLDRNAHSSISDTADNVHKVCGPSTPPKKASSSMLSKVQ